MSLNNFLCIQNLSFDWVEIHDGNDENGTILGCGTKCGNIAPTPIISSGNVVFIRFHSDRYLTGSGFDIAYETGM